MAATRQGLLLWLKGLAGWPDRPVPPPRPRRSARRPPAVRRCPQDGRRRPAAPPAGRLRRDRRGGRGASRAAPPAPRGAGPRRTEERRVGKTCVSEDRLGGSPDHNKKKIHEK